MDESIRESVRRRAQDQCEYCRMPQSLIKLRHQIDHIIARQHRGPSTEENLALICQHCNLHKGPNIAGIDPETAELTRLFNPRSQNWNEHFKWRDAELIGLTAIGRTTLNVLAINEPLLLEVRAALVTEGAYPVS
jgi:5-methylcytosine-specific restriction endonuclease McrA